MSIRNLDSIFKPKSVALIGASRRPGSVGAVLAHNLMTGGFDGPVFPVNPGAEAIQSVMAYPDVESLPSTPDLAVVCTPPDTVPGVIDALGRRGTKGAVVITAGFGELGDEGKALQQKFLDAAKPHLMRIVGPNCVGVIAPQAGLNASFAHIPALKGNVGFLAQSGAIITSVLDWATARGIGFSHMVSLGGMADVDFGDMLDYLARDPGVKSILLYVESITNARKFMSAARAASRVKPVVVIKAGRHEEAAKAAASHTGAMAGSDAVYTAAFRRAGMLRVLSLEELFDAVETLANRPRIKGDRLAIVTNGGGMGVLATDGLLDQGGRLAELAPETIEALNKVLPPTWSHANPVDIIGDAGRERYAGAMEAVLQDKAVDAVLVLNCPVAVADSLDAARAVVDAHVKTRTPIFTSWLGAKSAEQSRALFAANRVPTYETPDQAVRAFMHIVRYEKNQAVLMETPPPTDQISDDGRKAARDIVMAAVDKGRTWLTEPEAKHVLKGYGVPVVETETVSDVEGAVEAAEAMGYPVALKILSGDITHKTDVGGVALSLKDAEAVRKAAETMLKTVGEKMPNAGIDGFTVQQMANRPSAHELIVGLVDDATFGPVVLFGQGGTAVEVVKDKAIALPPLNLNLAHDLISRTRVSKLLAGYRERKPADVDAIAQTLIKLADIAADIPEVAELDINPLWADQHGVLALDARIKVAKPKAEGVERFAVRPYPRDMESRLEDRAGVSFDIRPIRPEDEPLLNEMISRCDPEDIRMRFFSAMRKLPRQLAARLSQIDYDREMAFVAFEPSGAPRGEQRMAGVVRLAADPDFDRAEYSVIVRSDRKGEGLGYQLMTRIIEHARAMGVRELFGDVLAENRAMLDMCKDLGFTKHSLEGEADVVEVRLALSASE